MPYYDYTSVFCALCYAPADRRCMKCEQGSAVPALRLSPDLADLPLVFYCSRNCQDLNYWNHKSDCPPYQPCEWRGDDC